MEYSDEGCAVADATVVHHAEQILDRDPGHFLGLRDVRRLPDLLGAGPEKDLMRRVGYPDRRLELDHPPKLVGSPAGLLLDLASRGGKRVLFRLDDADWDLPAPGVIDEAMTSKHQQLAAGGVKDSCHRDSLHPQNVVLEALAIRGLHINEAYVDPAAGVDRALAVRDPLRSSSFAMVLGRHGLNVLARPHEPGATKVAHLLLMRRHQSATSPPMTE